MNQNNEKVPPTSRISRIASNIGPHIPSTLIELLHHKKATVLNLHANEIKFLSVEPGTGEQLVHLKELDISSNHLNKLDDCENPDKDGRRENNIFKFLPNLETLNLSANCLSSDKITRMFQFGHHCSTLQNLCHLNISHNELHQLFFLESNLTLPNLKTLHAKNNKIPNTNLSLNKLCESLFCLRLSLEVLDLSENPVEIHHEFSLRITQVCKKLKQLNSAKVYNRTFLHETTTNNNDGDIKAKDSCTSSTSTKTVLVNKRDDMKDIIEAYHRQNQYLQMIQQNFKDTHEASRNNQYLHEKVDHLVMNMDELKLLARESNEPKTKHSKVKRCKNRSIQTDFYLTASTRNQSDKETNTPASRDCSIKTERQHQISSALPILKLILTNYENRIHDQQYFTNMAKAFFTWKQNTLTLFPIQQKYETKMKLSIEKYVSKKKKLNQCIAEDREKNASLERKMKELIKSQETRIENMETVQQEEIKTYQKESMEQENIIGKLREELENIQKERQELESKLNQTHRKMKKMSHELSRTQNNSCEKQELQKKRMDDMEKQNSLLQSLLSEQKKARNDIQAEIKTRCDELVEKTKRECMEQYNSKLKSMEEETRHKIQTIRTTFEDAAKRASANKMMLEKDTKRIVESKTSEIIQLRHEIQSHKNTALYQEGQQQKLNEALQTKNANLLLEIERFRAAIEDKDTRIEEQDKDITRLMRSNKQLNSKMASMKDIIQSMKIENDEKETKHIYELEARQEDLDLQRQQTKEVTRKLSYLEKNQQEERRKISKIINSLKSKNNFLESQMKEERKILEDSNHEVKMLQRSISQKRQDTDDLVEKQRDEIQNLYRALKKSQQQSQIEKTCRDNLELELRKERKARNVADTKLKDLSNNLEKHRKQTYSAVKGLCKKILEP